MASDAGALESIRDAARVKLKGVCGVFRTCDGLDTRTCQGHSYGSPIGMGGIGSGASFANNVRALAALRLHPRLIGPDFTPDVRFTFFGKDLAMPVMAASVSGCASFGGNQVITEEEFCRAVTRGCKDAGTMGWRGDSFNYSLDRAYGIDAIAEAGGWGVQIVKPRSQEAVKAFFARAAQAGCTAVGIDIDGCGSYAMNAHRQPVFRKTVQELRECIESTPLPVIIKGIMAVRDAEAAVQAGARAIVVSNHGGRVLDHTPGTAEVLPAIVSAVGGRTMVLADGGIRTGYDVLKMLALGARAVLVGRDVARAAIGGGAEGVRVQMEYLGMDLARAMRMTGCASLDDIGAEVLR